MQDSFKDSTGNVTQVELDGNNKIPVAVGAFGYANITTLNTFLLKVGSGTLHSITFNAPVATGVVKVYDNNEGAGPIIATSITPAVYLAFTLFYDIAFTGGLTIVTSVAAQDITVSYK